jgi:phosphopantetheinyl transferase (holo-ACP synthase)
MSNIIGLGIDATDIPRIAATLERYGERFMNRIFTDGEIASCRRRRVPATHRTSSGVTSRSCAAAGRRNCSSMAVRRGASPQWARNRRS